MEIIDQKPKTIRGWIVRIRFEFHNAAYDELKRQEKQVLGKWDFPVTTDGKHESELYLITRN